MNAVKRLLNTSRYFVQSEGFTVGNRYRFYHHSNLNCDSDTLKEAYQKTKEKCNSKKLPNDVNPRGVFACNELDLEEVKVYGFDYDYTLAVYKPALDFLLYQLGTEALIKKFKYPQEISKIKYEPGFAIRGLHYDIEKGLLMKLDSFLQIQLGTVFKGLSKLSDKEVLEIYKNKTIPLSYVETQGKNSQHDFEDLSQLVPDQPDGEESGEGMAVVETVPLPAHLPTETGSNTTRPDEKSFNKEQGKKKGKLIHKKVEKKYFTSKMVQLADLFSVPEMTLLCNIAEYFEKNNIDYYPEILFWDVKNSVASSHLVMHRRVQKDTSSFIELNPGLRNVFERLRSANKKLFLVTNSPFPFVNCGMNSMVGQDWQDLFDIVIVQARKPRFFTDESRPIRVYDKASDSQLWGKVTSLSKGKIYCEGTITQLQDLTGWQGDEVLYFGDHPYSDLADVTLAHGWKTGAIINELTHEIETLNKEDFKKNCNWLQMLTQLMEECQDSTEPGAEEILNEWMKERDQIRQDMKDVFNKQFGSVFRTYNNPTYFSRRLFRFADIYTSNITNLLDYSVNHTFYPRRGVMPHEYSSYFV